MHSTFIVFLCVSVYTLQSSSFPVCGDGNCEETEGEDCSTCPSDCGSCPLAVWQIALIAVFAFIFVAVIVIVIGVSYLHHSYNNSHNYKCTSLMSNIPLGVYSFLFF